MNVLALTTIYNDKTPIPVNIRRILNLKNGDKIIWVEDKDSIYVKRADGKSLGKYAVTT